MVTTNDARKSILVVNKLDDIPEDAEETEISAQVSLPPDGGWGWAVVFSAFMSLFVMDGVVFSFGSLLPGIVKDLKSSDAMIALINSVCVAIYLICGPIDSAFINRFGFRACAMTGSIISSTSLLFAYFSSGYTSLLVFYGVFAGAGYSLINMSASLVVGFYFEKLRSLALSMSLCGSSLGVMVWSPINAYIEELVGWRIVILLQSSLLGTLYFFGMVYRPLVTLSVGVATAEPTKTVTYLPSKANMTSRTGLKAVKVDQMFNAVSNTRFPTAANVIKEEERIISEIAPGPSISSAVSKLTITPNTPQGGFSQYQLKQVKSLMSSTDRKNIEVKIITPEKKGTKPKLWEKICSYFRWESHVKESRPMYRDDAFYAGDLKHVPQYQKSTMAIPVEERTGLEYQLEVSRVAAVQDLRENKKLCSPALRRVLATMLNINMLTKKSFIAMSFSSFFYYMGYLVPFIYIKEVNEQHGAPAAVTYWFVSVIGFSNAVGRISMGLLAIKFHPGVMYAGALVIAGVWTMISQLSYNIYYQFTFCAVYGFCVASVATLRSLLIINYYGLENLTNATGLLFVFTGVGGLMSTPLAGVVKDQFGFSTAFYMSGGFIVLSGFFIILFITLASKENVTQIDESKKSKSSSHAHEASTTNTVTTQPTQKSTDASDKPTSILKQAEPFIDKSSPKPISEKGTAVQKPVENSRNGPISILLPRKSISIVNVFEKPSSSEYVTDSENKQTVENLKDKGIFLKDARSDEVVTPIISTINSESASVIQTVITPLLTESSSIYSEEKK